VREKAVGSLCKVCAALPDQIVVEHYLPLVKVGRCAAPIAGHPMPGSCSHAPALRCPAAARGGRVVHGAHLRVRALRGGLPQGAGAPQGGAQGAVQPALPRRDAHGAQGSSAEARRLRQVRGAGVRGAGADAAVQRPLPGWCAASRSAWRQLAGGTSSLHARPAMGPAPACLGPPSAMSRCSAVHAEGDAGQALVEPRRPWPVHLGQLWQRWRDKPSKLARPLHEGRARRRGQPRAPCRPALPARRPGLGAAAGGGGQRRICSVAQQGGLRAAAAAAGAEIRAGERPFCARLCSSSRPRACCSALATTCSAPKALAWLYGSFCAGRVRGRWPAEWHHTRCHSSLRCADGPRALRGRCCSCSDVLLMHSSPLPRPASPAGQVMARALQRGQPARHAVRRAGQGRHQVRAGRSGSQARQPGAARRGATAGALGARCPWAGSCCSSRCAPRRAGAAAASRVLPRQHRSNSQPHPTPPHPCWGQLAPAPVHASPATTPLTHTNAHAHARTRAATSLKQTPLTPLAPATNFAPPPPRLVRPQGRARTRVRAPAA
jgi:hypothetical protein